jgi:hypothetical protein
VLQRALGGNPTEKKLYYVYSKVLFEAGGTNEELLYNLRRAFIAGDKNYDAQVLYGRQLFISGERAASKELFASLSKARVPADTRDRILYPLEQAFRGRVTKIEAVYCFIARDGINDWIFASRGS